MSRRGRLDKERDRSRSPISHGRSATSPPRQTTGKANSNRIVFRGLPQEYGWAKVKDLFREQIGFTGYIEWINNGVGVMEFRSVDGAIKAIEKMDGFKLEKGAKLRVSSETSRDRQEFESRKPRHERSDMNRSMNGNSGRYAGGFSHNDSFRSDRSIRDSSFRNDRDYPNSGTGCNDDRRLLSPQVLNYLGIDGPITNQIFVWNLDYAVSWQRLKDVFRLAGNVLNVDVKESKDGSPRGNAVVTYEQPIEAVQAISLLNTQQFMNRPMRIRMDRDARPGNSSAEQFLGRRNSTRGTVGLPPNGRLPRDLQSVGLTLQELAGKLMASNAPNQMSMPNVPSFGGMNSMGVMPNNNVSNNFGMNTMPGGNLSNMDNFGNMAMGQMGTPNMMGGLRGGADSGYMRQMAAMAMAAGFGAGGNIGGPSGDRETRRIILKNLPLSYDWKDLKRLVRDAGEVRYADVLYDSNQQSTGFGTVRFATPGDAERAVRKLDGFGVEGRNIRAELDFKD